MRLWVPGLLTLALLGGCAGDDEGTITEEPVSGDEAPAPDRPPEFEDTAPPPADPASDEVQDFGMQESERAPKAEALAVEGQEEGWQDPASGAASAAQEAVNNIREGSTGRSGSSGLVGQHTVNTLALIVRSGPGKDHQKKRTLRLGESVSVFEESNGWARIGDGEWVASDFLRSH